MSASLRVVFAGTPAFAATVFRALIGSSHTVVAAYAQPDRRAGRGRKIRPGPVSMVAREHEVTLRQPDSLKGEAAARALAALDPDVMVVAAYGLLLPTSILEVPRLGCINIHASLLPRWRGAAPIQRAIIAGDAETGISIMQMDAGLDTGPVLAVRKCPIEARDTARSLAHRLAVLGADALLATLSEVERGRVAPAPQDEARATYAGRIGKAEGRLDWSRPARDLERRIRAFDPWPVAFTDDGERRLRIWESELSDGSSSERPGTVVGHLPAGIEVATGEGVLRLLRLQLPGRQPVAARDFLHANPLPPGAVLGVGEI